MRWALPNFASIDRVKMFWAGALCEQVRLKVEVCTSFHAAIWVVVKIMVPFWVPIIIRHLLFRVPRKEP